ncbi:MAG: TIGR01212 family radical SAM protein [Oscillospiraceae bacterium]|nr:TIGR01212 family radical SAM protein [Oscillospiraceae bacterium]
MEHPYRTVNRYLQSKYGQKIRKICIDGGFTCPNRDGTCGVGGCTFCGERGAGEQLDPAKTIREQAEAVLSKAAPDSAWIVYFQNFTNTYAPAGELRRRYDAALFDDRVKILDIGTRPDCITGEIAALLAEYNEKYEVWVELGLQTANDATAKALNRGYDLACFLRAVRLLHRYGLRVIVHMIIGLPGETKEDVLHTVEVINAQQVFGVKIHSLFVMKGTALAEQYQSGAFTPISMQEYIDRAIAAVTHLSPEIIIHRLTGNCLREYLLAPDWIIQRDLILVTIDRRMQANKLVQGSLYRDDREGHTMNRIKAVIFDLDGTLLDTLTDLANSVNLALTQNGYSARTRDEVRQFVGNGIAKLVERALPGGTGSPDYERVLADTRALYAQKCRENTAPYSGIPALLDALRSRGLQLAVVSNKPDAQVKSLCQEHFGDWIAVAIGQQEGVRLKPAPDSLLHAMELLHCGKDETVYVGDSDVDIQTAANAGIPCISVLWGFRDYALLKEAGGTVFVKSPAEMTALF